MLISSLEPISARTYQSSWVYTNTNDHAEGHYWRTEQIYYKSDKVFSVTLTSITPTEIKGTFSGKMNSNAMDITGGSFFAKVL